VVAAERRPATHEAKSAEAVPAVAISRATDNDKVRMAGISGNMRAKIGRYG
jgi:translation initiation factor IF-1